MQIIHDYSARCRYVLAMALSSVGTILDNRFYDGDRFVHLTDRSVTTERTGLARRFAACPVHRMRLDRRLSERHLAMPEYTLDCNTERHVATSSSRHIADIPASLQSGRSGAPLVPSWAKCLEGFEASVEWCPDTWNSLGNRTFVAVNNGQLSVRSARPKTGASICLWAA